MLLIMEAHLFYVLFRDPPDYTSSQSGSKKKIICASYLDGDTVVNNLFWLINSKPSSAIIRLIYFDIELWCCQMQHWRSRCIQKTQSQLTWSLHRLRHWNWVLIVWVSSPHGSFGNGQIMNRTSSMLNLSGSPSLRLSSSLVSSLSLNIVICVGIAPHVDTLSDSHVLMDPLFLGGRFDLHLDLLGIMSGFHLSEMEARSHVSKQASLNSSYAQCNKILLSILEHLERQQTFTGLHRSSTDHLLHCNASPLRELTCYSVSLLTTPVLMKKASYRRR